MNKVDKRKRSSYRNRNIDRTSSRKKRRPERPMNNRAFDAKEPNLGKLPSSCLQHILSFVTYDKVSQMRQVSKVFNKIGKNLLDKGQKELEGRLKTEIEWAEKRKAHFSINARSSEDMLRFLNSLYEAINNCTIAYSIYIKYFVAGKLLDEANSLLNDFNSSTVVPYFPEHVYKQKSHPCLGPIVAHSQKAVDHFTLKIVGKFIRYDEDVEVDRDEQINLEVDVMIEQNKRKIMNINLLKNLRRKIDCGNQIGEENLKLIFKFNEKVINLAQRAKKMDEEIERVVNGRNLLDKGHSNYWVLQIPLAETKDTEISGKKKLNLATLPVSCIQKIVSYTNCDKMAHMRAVCKSFNNVCKEGLNQELEKLKRSLEFKMKCYEKRDMSTITKIYYLKLNMLRDIRSFLQLCENNHKFHFGTKCYFTAGEVLDEAVLIFYNHQHQRFRGRLNRFLGLDDDKEPKPHSSLYRFMDMVYKYIAHVKFTTASMYLPSTQSQTYVQDDIIRGDARMIEKESRLNLEEIEKLVKEAEVKIKEQNDKNRKLLKIISSLKKNVFILNETVSKKNECFGVGIKFIQE